MTKSWEFTRTMGGKKPLVMITVELRDEEDYLGAYADDSYYYGSLTKEQSIELARAVLEKLATPFPFGTYVRVVDGNLTGSHGFINGTLVSGDVLVMMDGGGDFIVPAKFIQKA